MSIRFWTSLATGVLIMVSTSVLNGSVSAEEDEIPWDKLRNAACHYLEACVPKKDVTAMEKKLKNRVEQRMKEDESASEDNVLRALMLDWAAGNEGKIKRKEQNAVRQACYYFVIFHDKNYSMPSQIITKMTHENVKEIMDYLEAQISAEKERKK